MLDLSHSDPESRRYGQLHHLPMEGKESPRFPLPPTFDLTDVRNWVTDFNPDWSETRLIQAEHDLRHFYSERKTDGNQATRNWRTTYKVPENPDADVMWHAHIILTEKYAEDCHAYLGFFLHHECFTRASCIKKN